MTQDLPPIDPQKAALLVMDYQNAIVGMLANPDRLLAAATEAIATVRRADGHLGYVRVAFTDADFAAIPPTSRMGARVSASEQAFHDNSPTTAIHERVAPEPGDIIVRKRALARSRPPTWMRSCGSAASTR
jgi:nicotinamidase-related amidase